ncbi:MAG: LysM peptidoglycan-binding domain-containing protein, partial [Candidatus Hydrogenedentes bacterium]|nr:LysM peptidoglycan-binding domain-containing protein [Candidatus Hydrogenedentota bacterium]
EMGIVMPPAESILIAAQVLEALSRIHAQGIVHRDIKPSNIMLTYTESGTVCAKLMDFGVSRYAEQDEQLSRLTTTESGGPGTPLYMAPEQIDSRTFGEVSYATDVYAMGIMLYQLLSGKPPFRGTLTEVLNGHLNMPVPPIVVKLDGVLPEVVENLLKHALAKKTAERIQTAKAFREELIKLTGVGDTMSRLNVATVQLASASSAQVTQPAQPGMAPLSTQTSFGGNTIMRLARYRRSVRVLGAGVAFVAIAIIATAFMMFRGGGGDPTEVASNEPVGDVVSGALTQPSDTAPQPGVPPADPNAPIPGTPTVAIPTTAPTAQQPGVTPPTDPSQPVSAPPAPGTTTAATPPATDPANPGVPPTTTTSTTPPAEAPSTDPAMLASNQPNAATPGAPVIVGGATVQTPGGDAVAPTGAPMEYTVKSGDTLSKIAAANSITVEDLRWWNNILNPYSLKVGQSLKLAASADIQPKEEFLAAAAAAEKARKEAAAAEKAKQEAAQKAAAAPAPQADSAPTLESSFKGTPVPAPDAPAEKDVKPRRGLFRGPG